MERALSSIRARADHLRHTVARLEHNLAWNPASTWYVFSLSARVFAQALALFLSLIFKTDMLIVLL